MGVFLVSGFRMGGVKMNELVKDYNKVSLGLAVVFLAFWVADGMGKIDVFSLWPLAVFSAVILWIAKLFQENYYAGLLGLFSTIYLLDVLLGG